MLDAVHFPDGDCNWLTNPALDQFARIPEYKVCACRIEKLSPQELCDAEGVYITQARYAQQQAEQRRETLRDKMPV